VKRTLAAFAVVLAFAGSAMAQTPPPVNAGAIKLTAGYDIPSLYYFRGIRQEADPKFTSWPYGDVGITLASADKGLKSVAVNFGVWNSLHTGSSGTDGSSGQLHYEEDFYSTLTLGFSAMSTGVKYIAYTSPNESYKTVKEIDLLLNGTQKYAPYAVFAFELSDASADGGANKGSYLELGATPSWPVGKMTFGVPVSLGFSLKDYYEDANGDNKFGFFDLGGMLTIPFSSVPTKYGTWNVHGRVDYFAFGDTTKQFNKGDTNGFTGLIGIGLSY
jgi:hypothetical protein